MQLQITSVNEKNPQEQRQLKSLWVGIGCQRGSSRELIAAAIQQVFEENQLDQSAIAGFATIETKASELGLVELCRLRNLPLKTFAAPILSTVCVPSPNKITNEKVGTPSVAEAAAILAASSFTPDVVVKQKLKIRLLVPKQIFRLQEQPGAVTIAVAQKSIPLGN
ncbi:cobalamin biosynthesis protein [Nostocaceae cyanobacterium CENA357]|uniref:Cobalamin biosynthesis protein n=1 Tax=Atlanticothrix silvestris CENA357 TaxID=1725252 RepID=A0A8J7HN54_9CYAN|nr:cobalamin biosynthesis protein [Atlanticothrix silvestris]MBH8556249.1 cobalamin biosynthesis protein [Atlanticothrix silvestris CENA357]